MEYLLYRFASKADSAEGGSRIQIQGECVTFSPFSLRWTVSMLQAGGVEFVKVIVLSAWCVAVRLASHCDLKVWAYVGCDGRILHYSVVVPTTMHLPWLSKDMAGNEIGGCLTVSRARGRRVFPHVLQQIALRGGRDRPLYMIVEKNNLASRAGMERAGFEIARPLQRETRLGRPPIYRSRDDS